MEDIKQMLELMDRPAFCAEDGCIRSVNSAAAVRQFCIGTPVQHLLTSGQEEYRSFRSGCLWLQLRCCDALYGASVTMVGNRQIFTLEPEDTDAELRLLNLAAQTLREPLGNVMALAEELDSDRETVARIQRGLYQLLRIVGNMTPPPAFRPEMQDISALIREFAEKILPACESRDVALRFLVPARPVYSCVDGELLTRAVYNLISNALKFAPPGSSLHLELKAQPRSYQIILQDQGSTPFPICDAFTRYRREPGIGDGREGLGLGLKLVRLAATAHGGVVLLRSTEQGTQAMLSLPIRQNAPLHSPRLRISYSGERDPMLVELSDVLPAEYYK